MKKYSLLTKSILLFLPFFMPSPFLLSNTVYYVPYARYETHQNFFNYSPQTPDNQLNLSQLLAKRLKALGYTLKPSTLVEFASAPKALQKDDYLICIEAPIWTSPNWRDILKKLPKKRVILLAYEPPSVRRWLYAPKTLSLFGKVLTWDDDLVQKNPKKFFKYQYPDLKPMIAQLVPFAKKKLLTQISGNKTSDHPNELYSERRKAILYFEQKKGSDFEFYGTGWEVAGLKNYRGAPANKIEVLKNYRFAICYENIKNIKGYITEKILDCFAAGCVPVYWGASNITQYIPKNCFIAREDFPSFDALVAHLKNMKEAEYNRYIANIQGFLQTSQAKKFTKPELVGRMIKCLGIEKGQAKSLEKTKSSPL